MQVLYLQDTNLERCGIVDTEVDPFPCPSLPHKQSWVQDSAEGATFCVPLPAAYAPTGEFFFRPIRVEDPEAYEPSAEGVAWPT